MSRKEPQAFVALPPDAQNQGLWAVIETTLRGHGVRAESLDDVSGSSVVQGVQERIRETDFVIADISGANANVMYEVGMALGMGKRVLLLSNERSPDLPFDLAAQQVAIYRPGNVDSVRTYLELWLRDVISELASSSA
jgi:hypothetical protein